MMKHKNFSNMPLGDIPVDDEYVECNFTRTLPIDIGGGVMRGVRLFPGDDTPRIFSNCNLTNCETPPGSTVNGGNTNIVNNRLLAREDIIRVNGQEVARARFHDHIHFGRYNPETESYDDIPSPVAVPGDYS